MREDSHPFCAVCRQRLALAFFENPRVATAAPVAWTAPASPVTTDELVEFEVGARVGLAPAAYAWTVEGPGLPAEGALEATGTTSFLRRFTAPGAYTVTCRVTADADWVKPERAGANLATITWRVYVGDDEDHDARADSVDNCPAVANANQRDTDGDGSGDACDADDDADGVPDGSDNCPLAANPGQQDGDADGVGDVCEADTDDDGVPDAADDCPLQADAAQDDADLDGTGDACELDDDADSVPDAGDNCPRVLNPSQLDSDGDGTGNACDADADGDGVLERDDNCPRAANADQADLDGDGSGNACDGDYDGDGDGVPDLQDNCPAAENADQADGDRDGVGDACDPLRMLGPAADTVVYTDVAPRFCWDTGPRGKYFVEWSRKEEFGSVKKTLVAFDLGCYQPVLDWLKVLKLADDSGQFYWRVRAKSSSERLVTPASRLVLSPVIAPEITGPASDEPLDCADDPPEIDWDGNHNTRFRVLFSATADMKQPVRVPSDGYGLFSTAVTLTSAQWRNVCKLVGGAGTVYARLDAKDNLDRRSSSQPRPLTIVTTDEGLVANP
ncbi:MAG: thrombospondin type 3 repeat-containing protein [Acidobacteria bacterium]|nr:thrombospondin type 3 repeat-containing protein [Acidobacteriota bacterium]